VQVDILGLVVEHPTLYTLWEYELLQVYPVEKLAVAFGSFNNYLHAVAASDDPNPKSQTYPQLPK